VASAVLAVVASGAAVVGTAAGADGDGAAAGAEFVNVNVPSTGSPSGEITRQATVIAPGGSGPTGWVTVTSDAWAAPLLAFRPSAPVTVTVGWVAAPLNVNVTALTAVATVLPAAGFEARNRTCAEAGAAGRSIVTTSPSAPAAAARVHLRMVCLSSLAPVEFPGSWTPAGT
jgi:hypothetical protein